MPVTKPPCTKPKLSSSKPPSSKINYLMEYSAFLLSKTILTCCPMELLMKKAGTIGKCTFYGIRIRRKVMYANLTYAFRKHNCKLPIDIIVQQVYTHFFKTLLELLNSKHILNHREKYIQIRHLDRFTQSLKKGKGGILVTGHFGNFELGALALASAGLPISVVVKPLRNTLIDKEINTLRKSFGAEVVTTDNAGRKILSALRRNRIVCLLADQDVGISRGTMVNFFGHPTSTPTGPARIALQTGAPLLPCFIYRQDNGSHVLEIGQPIQMDYSKNGRGAEIKRVTQEISLTLEKWVLHYPEQYFWLHRRWKSTDEGKRLYNRS